jgi:hypothetical protein
MRPIRLISIFLLISTTAFSQKIRERDIVSFRIYDYKTFPEGKDFSAFTDEEISGMKYYEVPGDSLKGSVGNPRPLLLPPFMKGSFFVTVDLKDGKRRRLKVSTYGGFYRDLESGKYYSISEGRSAKFQEILRKADRHMH